MLKFNVKLFLFFILLINSTIVFASKDIVDFPWERHNKLENLESLRIQLQKNIAELQTCIATLQKDIAELQKNNDNESKKMLELKYSLLTILKQQLKRTQEFYDDIRLPNFSNSHRHPKPIRPPKSIYFTGKDKVWHWHSSFDFISVTIHPQVKIHTKPSIDAPVHRSTEHDFVSIVDIQPGPGSIRGWGLLVAYKGSKNGWINLDDASILWCIKTYDGYVIRYWHWEKGESIPLPEAYCVDPRQ